MVTKLTNAYKRLKISWALYYKHSPILWGEKIGRNEKDGAFSTYGGEERCIQGFVGEI
jgi:hypothetical protein